jgi:hypothetical protein
MEPGALIPEIALLLIVVAGLLIAPKYFSSDKKVEALSCVSGIPAVKVAIEKMLIAKPIKCEGVERYWGPAKTLSESNDGAIIVSSIYYEKLVDDEDGSSRRVTEKLALTVKLYRRDSRTNIEYLFDQKETMFTASQAQQIMTETRARLSQVLMNLELGHLH